MMGGVNLLFENKCGPELLRKENISNLPGIANNQCPMSKADRGEDRTVP